jgi:alpha-N-arabinofuranosidase
VASQGSLTVLTSARPEDTNTINDPAKVRPVTTRINGLGARFTRTFAPYSLSVLELQTR